MAEARAAGLGLGARAFVAFPGGTASVCRAVRPDSYLAPGHLSSFHVKQTGDWRQLIKVKAVNKSYLWAFPLSAVDALRLKQIVTRGGNEPKLFYGLLFRQRGPPPTFLLLHVLTSA